MLDNYSLKTSDDGSKKDERQYFRFFRKPGFSLLGAVFVNLNTSNNYR